MRKIYDTIEIMSPEIEQKTINEIRLKSIETQRIDMETGDILIRLTTSELVGSHDARLSIRIIQGNKVKVGGSVHKFILGHNCFGGPTDIKDCCRYLVSLAIKKLKINLPNWSKWELMRVDVAHVFDMGNIKQVEELISSMRGCTYPRRKPINFGATGMYFPGASTTLKVYHKGAEFKKHDISRINRFKKFGLLDSKVSTKMMQAIADRLVRFEVEIRKRKMKYDKMDNMVINLIDTYFDKVYKREVLKVFKEGESDMVIVKNAYEVRDRLNQVYKKQKANNLFNVWSRIQIMGENLVKNDVDNSTWWRYKRDFSAAGVSMKGNVDKTYIVKSIAKKEEFARVYDFVPLPGERYHVGGIFLDVKKHIELLEITA